MPGNYRKQLTFLSYFVNTARFNVDALAALAATASFAQSSVTIGGQLDVGLQSQKFASGKSVNNLGSGIHGASRVWITGTEDLGGGMSANWRLEMQPNLADGSTSSNLFNRGSWAGLKGGFGELRAGRQGTNTVAVVCALDQHGCYSGFSGGGLLFSGQGAAGSAGNALFAANPTPNATAALTAATTGQATSTAGDSTRYVNQLRYSLPTLAKGLSVNVAYAFGKANTPTANGTDGDSVGVDAAYANGPLTLVGAYQQAKAEAGSTKKGDLTTVGGLYDFGMARVGLGYQKEGADNNALFTKAEAYALTVTMPMGAATPYFKYGERKYSGGSAGSTKTAEIANIGVRYALSKRSLIYADYVTNGAAKLDASASLKNQTSIGLQHNF